MKRLLIDGQLVDLVGPSVVQPGDGWLIRRLPMRRSSTLRPR
jgi:hypothetical protein